MPRPDRHPPRLIDIEVGARVRDDPWAKAPVRLGISRRHPRADSTQLRLSALERRAASQTPGNQERNISLVRTLRGPEDERDPVAIVDRKTKTFRHHAYDRVGSAAQADA